MNSAAFSTFLQANDFMPYLVAMALMFGGVALIVYSVRRRQLEVADRVETMAVSQSARQYEVAHHEPFLRLPAGTGVERENREIVRLCSRIGIPPQYAGIAYALSRVAFAIMLAILVFVGSHMSHDFSNARMIPALLALMGAILGWLIPSFLIQHLAKKRAEDVAAGLPDALELLVVCVGAGLALEDGIDRIVGELKHGQPALAEELALTSADMKILPSRDQALANLAQRVDVPSVRSVVATLSQTMRYGTPLAQALRVVASEMRNDELIQMEARANRLPTFLTLPMMLFIMPTIFLIVGGPAALRVIDTLF